MGQAKDWGSSPAPHLGEVRGRLCGWGLPAWRSGGRQPRTADSGVAAGAACASGAPGVT